MHTFQVDTGKTTKLSENNHKTIKTSSKYVFKPEIVKPLAKHGYHGRHCDSNLPRSLQMGQDGLSKGLKEIFIKKKNTDDKSKDSHFVRKRSCSLFDSQDRRSVKESEKWTKSQDGQCSCRKCETIQDLPVNKKFTDSCKNDDISRLRNQETKCEKNGGRNTTDKINQDTNYPSKSSFTSSLENENKKENEKFTFGDEQLHVTNTNDFIRNQNGPQSKIEETHKGNKHLNTSVLSSGFSLPSNNHVDLPSLTGAENQQNCLTKSVQEDFKNSVKCEGCGEYHWPDDLTNVNFQVEYFVGNGQLQQKAEEVKEIDRSLETPVSAVLYRSRSLPQLSTRDSGVASINERVPGRPSSRLVADLRQLLTLKQHYYPEGGWGWVIVVVGLLVQVLTHGLHGAVGTMLLQVATNFGPAIYLQAGWLGALSTGVALLISPITIAFCRRKSTRLTAVLGGIITALGCLFTSFATQFHQLFFSYGTVVGVGVGITRDCSTLMVAQYFKRRREFVEIFIVSGSGLGIAIMSAFIKGTISKMGWRLGLQIVTAVVSLTFLLGTFYRSASLYHPQRRAILHLKNQKRKIKDKNKADDRPPFFDFSTLKSKTVRILLISTGISAFGINTPIFYLAHEAEEEGLGDTVIILHAYLGLAWTLGCVTFGLLVVYHNVECRIARQYLTQTAMFMCGLCILALTTLRGNYHGYVMFTWIYGIFCGGYHYSLKMYTYERVRARNFAKTWGFVQCSQAIPIAIGVPISGYINVGCGGKAGYYFSSACILVGSFTLFFIDLHRRNLSRHKHTRENGTRHLCVNDSCPMRKKLSFSQEPENEGVAAGAAGALALSAELAPVPGELMDALVVDKPELTCISEEGIADIDLPDNILDDLDYIGDCITSCNKVENYLMLSEFENNLIAEMPIIMDRKGRRWSLAKSKGPLSGSQSGSQLNQMVSEEEEAKPKWRLMSAPSPNRGITVIDEAST